MIHGHTPSISISLLPQILSFSSIPKPKLSSIPAPYKSCISISPLSNKIEFCSPFPTFPPRNSQTWKVSAFPQNIMLLEASPVEDSQLLDSSTAADGTSTIIQALLFTALIGLSVLTIGVVYLSVTDFLQKREKDKFEKEEGANKKKNSNKGRIRSRARAGPRGFGQKIDEEDEDAE